MVVIVVIIVPHSLHSLLTKGKKKNLSRPRFCCHGAKSLQTDDAAIGDAPGSIFIIEIVIILILCITLTTTNTIAITVSIASFVHLRVAESC